MLFRSKIKREVSILNALKGYKAVPRLHEVVIDPVINVPSLILEYAEDNGMNFRKLSERMTPKDVKYYMKELLIVILKYL